jgi:hypothetical protein
MKKPSIDQELTRLRKATVKNVTNGSRGFRERLGGIIYGLGKVAIIHISMLYFAILIRVLLINLLPYVAILAYLVFIWDKGTFGSGTVVLAIILFLYALFSRDEPSVEIDPVNKGIEPSNEPLSGTSVEIGKVSSTFGLDSLKRPFSALIGFIRSMFRLETYRSVLLGNLILVLGMFLMFRMYFEKFEYTSWFPFSPNFISLYLVSFIDVIFMPLEYTYLTLAAYFPIFEHLFDYIALLVT